MPQVTVQPQPQPEKQQRPEDTADLEAMHPPSGFVRVDGKEGLTEDQVQLHSDLRRRGLVTLIVCAAGFFDIAGAVILQPSVPMMMSNAPGAVRPRSWPAGYTHPQAFPEESFGGLPYPFAVNSVLVLNMCGNMFSSMAMGWLSDKFGRKPLMVVGLSMGCTSLVLYYVAGTVVQSVWFFLGCVFLNGLFGGNKTVIQAYVKDVWGKDFMKVQPIMFFCFMIGGAGGGVLGGVATTLAKVDDLSGNLFIGAPICAGLSFILTVLMVLLVAEAPRFGKPAGTADKPAQDTPKLVKRILWVVIVAGACDAFGDQGNVFARNTIFSNRYPEGKGVTINMAMIIIKCLGVILAMFIVLASMRRTGLPIWCLVGNFCSAAAQFAVAPNAMPFGGFIAIWAAAQVFGYTSTLGANFVLPRFAPPEQMGFWMGLNSSSNLFGRTFAPLLLSAIYSALLPPAGSPTPEYQTAELACLLVCGCTSLLAFVLYLPLPRLIPSTSPKDGQGALGASRPMEEYEAMTAVEWRRLGHSERTHANIRRRAEGKPAILTQWASYQEDLADGGPLLLAERSQLEMQEVKRVFTGMLTDRDRLAEAVKNHGVLQEELGALCDRGSTRQALGCWLADYLEDAGYHQWAQHPDLFKTMLMSAFPAIDALDGRQVRISSAADMEMHVMGLLRTVDQHLYRHKHMPISAVKHANGIVAA